MKMCEAFAQIGLRVSLIHPHRIQIASLNGQDPFSYYGVDRTFRLQESPGLDLRRMLYGISPRIWFLIQAGSHAVSSAILTAPSWRRKDAIYYGRDLFSLGLLLAFKSFVAARVTLEVHSVPRRGRRWLGRLMERADRVVAISQELANLLVEAGVSQDKIIVEHDAVDLQAFDIAESQQECRSKLSLPRDRSIIGYIGRFEAMGIEKGVTELIRAMSYISSGNGKMPLLLAVGGPMEKVASYQELAYGLGLEPDTLLFLDRVPNAEVPLWIRACDVVTIPIPSSDHVFMSPMKLFEYMGAGVPILASDLPWLREVLHHGVNAWLARPGDSRALARGIELLLRDRDLAKRLTSQARKDVEHYTWRRRAQRIMAALVS